jgi:nuclear pore complex protein Nup188
MFLVSVKGSIASQINKSHRFELNSSKLCLLVLYYLTLHVCSGEQELTSLVMNDLYYHIHGELEGRQITSGPFQELLCFLLEFRCFERNASDQLHRAFPGTTDNILFDVAHTRDDLEVELWNHSYWKPEKEVAEKMLDIMHKANKMKCHADAELSTLRSFITFLSVYTGTVSFNVRPSICL